MQSVELENIRIDFDLNRTREFYASQRGFTCDCPDCTDYISKIEVVKSQLEGLDERLGINLTKDVGQGMDELMGHEHSDHNLYVVPYYIAGCCFMEGEEIVKQSNGPIWPKTKRAELKLTDSLSIIWINTTGSIEFEGTDRVLTMWIEFKTEKPKTEKYG